MCSEERTWAVVLAAGNGSRLSRLTATPEGHVPKQFCSFCDDRSLLSRTIERAAMVVPMQRIVVVVADQHRRWWEPELADLPAENVLVQAHDRGTANGLLLACTAILQRDLGATVLVLPSDHYIEDEEALRDGIERAVLASSRRGRDIVLLGITPEEPDTEYGWIVPAAGADHMTQAVGGFVEKPTAPQALQLMERGALWSSFIMVARLEALLHAFDATQPRLLDAFLGTVRSLGAAGWSLRVRELYASLPACDFSRDVLQQRVSSLRLLRLPMIGWSDLGTPDRLQRCLQQRQSRSAPTAMRRRPAASAPRRGQVALEQAVRIAFAVPA